LEAQVTLPRNILYYGSDAPLPEPITLRAGPLSMSFVSGEIHYIRLGDREILRRVYVAVRDHYWRTIPPSLLEIKKTIGEESFEVRFEIENKKHEVDFGWRGSIVGQRNGTISFAMEGAARSTFWRNRIGFCVLHSSTEWAGSPCSVETVDGARLDGEFPSLISPHQVFLGIRAISHEVLPGVQAEVRLLGDAYEMEDQRNWSDASYKTYSTPLSLPYPVEIKAGTLVSQTVTIGLKGNVPAAPPSPFITPAIFTLNPKRTVSMPRLGLSVSSQGRPLSTRAVVRLRALNLSHLRLDLDLSSESWESRLRQAADEAARLGVALEVALFSLTGAQKEMQALRAALDRLRPPIATWLVFHPSGKPVPEEWVKVARACLADYNPAAKFGSGANSCFAELNRCRPPTAALDLLCYPLNPQVHTFDNASLAENLEAQGPMARSAREFSGGVPLAISPITLKPRFNPNVTGLESVPSAGELPLQVDPRQMSLFGAGWTVGSLKHIGEAGVYSATYYETVGWRGVMESDEGPPLPEKFPSLPGSVFPLYQAFADWGEFAGGEIVPLTSSAPVEVEGLALRKDGRLRIMLANLTSRPQEVRVIAGVETGYLRLQSLDENSAEWAMRDPEAFRAAPGKPLQLGMHGGELDLLPYSVARLDLP
jgi:hypothetical protein